MFKKQRPNPWTALHPRFEVPEWEDLDFDIIDPRAFSRNMMALGEIGSGKTASIILPLVRAAYIYPSTSEYERYRKAAHKAGHKIIDSLADLRPSALIIDPKNEISSYVAQLQTMAPHISRNVYYLSLDKHNYRIWLFEKVNVTGEAAGDVAGRVLELSDSLVRQRRAPDAFWAREAERVISVLIQADYWVYRNGGIERLQSFWEDIHETVIDQVAQAQPQSDPRGNAFGRIYESLTDSFEKLRLQAIRLSVQFHDSPFVPELEKVSTLIDRFHGAISDLQRGSAFDALIAQNQKIIAWSMQWLAEGKRTEREIDTIVEFQVAAKTASSVGESLMHWRSHRIDADTSLVREALGNQPLQYDKNSYLTAIAALLNICATFHKDDPARDPVIDAYLVEARKYEVPSDLLYQLLALKTLPEKTFACVIAVINDVLEELASEALAKHISSNPFEAPDNLLSIEVVMNHGDWCVYVPGGEPTPLSTMVGKGLKKVFQSVTFVRANQARPIVILVDEAHHFISGDRYSADSSYFEMTRAYRCTGILASQSLAAIRYALSNTVQTPEMGSESLHALLNQMATKFYLRNMDLSTQSVLLSLLPAPTQPGRPHTINVRPINTLRTGEVYYFTPQPSTGRANIQLLSTEEETRFIEDSATVPPRKRAS